MYCIGGDKTAVAVPLAVAGASARAREYQEQKSQPLSDCGLREMGLWLAEAILRPEPSPEEQDQILRSALQRKVVEIFPERTVPGSNQDITSELERRQIYRNEVVV